jgi:hypothetical protein
VPPPTAPPAAEPAAPNGAVLDETAALADVKAAWPQVVARLEGPPVAVMTGSAPLALVEGTLTVGVQPTLFKSAARYAAELASAVAEICALRVQPAFVASERAQEPAAAASGTPAEPEPPLESQLGRFKQDFDAIEMEG